MKPRVDGMCDYCAVDGCASCGKIINECVECEESRVLDEFQQCVTVWLASLYYYYSFSFEVCYFFT